MKKLWTLCTCCLSVGMMWAQTGNWTDEGNYDTSWWDGNNRPEYHISTAEQLAGLSYLSSQGRTFPASRIILDNDLDMEAHYWVPIEEFTGFFDGNGHTLSGIHVQNIYGNSGFIATLKGYARDYTRGTVYNLTLDETCELASAGLNSTATVGGIVGEAATYTTIAACRFLGKITFDDHRGELTIGGIVGSTKGTVNSCRNEGAITVKVSQKGSAEAGGIVGVCNGKDIRITNCINQATLSGTSASYQSEGIELAGIVATNFSGSTINGCLNEGEVNIRFSSSQTIYSPFSAAGITTSNYGLVINSGNTGRIAVQSDMKATVGGISSHNSGSIVNSYNIGAIACIGRKGQTFYNNGGGITGVFQYSTIGITPLIYGCYNSGTVSSTGSEEQIGSIAGDASYLIDKYNVPTRIRNTYYSTETGKSIGNDYYQQSQYILGVFDMKGKDFRQDLNEAAQAYNDTATADKCHAWTGDNYTLPHFRTADVFSTGTDYYTAHLERITPNPDNVPSNMVLKYKKTTETDYTEIPWSGTETDIEVSPDTEYEYLLAWEENGMENLMPSKKFKTGNLFEELSAQPTRTTADLLALIKGDPAKVKNVSFEVGIGHPLEEGYKIIAVVDGSPMDETGFVRATVTGLQGNTSYCMRAIVKTEHETIYSSARFFTTKNTGVLCHTIELNATQTRITALHTLDTDKIEGTLKESGCYYVPFDTLEKHNWAWNDMTLWTKVKGEPSTHGIDKNVFKTTISGLIEGTKYSIKHYAIVNIPNEGDIEETFYNNLGDLYPTLPVKVSWALKEATQTTATLVCRFDTGDATVIEKGLDLNGKHYVLNGKDSLVTLTGLYPGGYYSPTAYVKTPHGTYASGWNSFSTLRVTVGGNVVEALQTSALVTVSSDLADPSAITASGVEWKVGNETFRKEGTPCRLTDLPAHATVSYRTFIQIGTNSTYSEWNTFTTQPISATIEAADACSHTSATLHALTACDTYSDAQFGFEWRKYDAPDLVPSNTVLAQPPVDGKLAFSLRSLTPSTYYKYRAFVKYQEKEYFSEWIGFGTADAFVLFPPTVQTITITSPDGTSVTLMGYIISGSEEILQKGFEYWTEDIARSYADKQTVIVDGEKMKAELHDLKPYTTYKYRSFAKTASGTTYGEEQTFTTGGASSIAASEAGKFSVHLTPNPVRESATLVVDHTQDGTVVYRIYSLRGNLIKHEEIAAQNGKTEIPVYAHDYTHGTYLIQVIYKDYKETIKMLVK